MPIVILILIILFVAIYLYFSIVKKAFLDKKTILYSIPLFIVSLVAYITGYMSSNDTFTFAAFSDCAVASIKIFSFAINTSLAGELYQTNALYSTCLNIIVVLGGLTLLSSLLSIFKIKLFNFIKVKVNLHKGKDVVIGYTELGLGYAKRNHGSVLIVDPTIHKLSKEEKKLLYTTNIPFLPCEINSKKFSKIRNINNRVNVLYFDDARHLNKLYDLIDNAETKKNTKFVFRVMCEPKVAGFVGEYLNYHCEKNPNISAYPTDKYEIIARNFALNHNISGLLPDGFVEDGLVKSGKEINVHILGFGNMGNAILKASILNNQFLTKTKNGLKVCPVNYHLYDCNEKNFKSPLLILDQKFDKIMDVKTISKPEKTFNIIPHKFDIRENFMDLYSKVDDNSFDLFIVCLDSSLRNVAIAKDLSKKLGSHNAVVLYNVDYKSEAYEETDTFKPFGFKNDFLTHEMIVDDKLDLLASLTNESYLKQLNVSSRDEFEKLPLFKKLSNIYFQISTKAKLNLVGLTYTDDENAKCISKEEFDKIFPTIKDPEYKVYSELKLQNVIARIEHERWNTFHILQGFTPLELTDYSFDRKKIHQDEVNKKHGCLTTYEDLDKVHKRILEVNKENGVTKTLEEVETYKYDFNLVADIYDNLTSIGYKIIVKK